MGACVSLRESPIIDLVAMEWDDLPEGYDVAYNVVFSSPNEAAEYCVHKCVDREAAYAMVDHLNTTRPRVMFQGVMIDTSAYPEFQFFHRAIVVTPERLEKLKQKRKNGMRNRKQDA